jgi:hypothetical protein
MMQRETTQRERGSVTFTIAVDDEVAAYLAQQGIRDVNGYMNTLLREEKARQQERGLRPANPHAAAGRNPTANDISRYAPDTSGYPENRNRHFSG